MLQNAAKIAHFCCKRLHCKKYMYEHKEIIHEGYSRSVKYLQLLSAKFRQHHVLKHPSKEKIRQKKSKKSFFLYFFRKKTKYFADM